jgi:hypothetical protein
VKKPPTLEEKWDEDAKIGVKITPPKQSKKDRLHKALDRVLDSVRQ